MIPSPPRIVDTGRRRIECGAESVIMGVVNVTPDSFSDGGAWLKPEAAVERAWQLAEEGAQILDVGGESSRPGAVQVSLAEELARVIPVVRGITRRLDLPISVDTCKPEVAAAALSEGAEIVNDITGLANPAMVEILQRTGAAAVAMHMRGTPATMQQLLPAADILEDVQRFFASVLLLPLDPDKIILDPGIGFGKTARDNLVLINRLDQLSASGRPILAGVSRKSFIGKVTGAAVEERLGGSLAAAVLAMLRGANVLRVHDVAQTRQALRTARAILTERDG